MDTPPNANAMDVHRAGDPFGSGSGHMNDPMVRNAARPCRTGASFSLWFQGSGHNRASFDYHPGRASHPQHAQHAQHPHAHALAHGQGLGQGHGHGHHGHHQQHHVKNESGDGGYLDMADFFGDSSTAVAVAAALPLHNGALYAHPTSQGNAPFPDLGRGLSAGPMGHPSHPVHASHAGHPMSDASLGSRCSDDDLDDAGIGIGIGIGIGVKSQDLSDLGKAFNTVMNDEFPYH